MWQVVYIAADKFEADNFKKRLSKEGFLVKVESLDDGSYQIKVPEIEAEEVYQLLSDLR